LGHQRKNRILNQGKKEIEGITDHSMIGKAQLVKGIIEHSMLYKAQLVKFDQQAGPLACISEARRLCEGIKFEKCHWKKQDPVLSQESIGHHSGARKRLRQRSSDVCALTRKRI